MSEKEMMLDVLHRLKQQVDTAVAFCDANNMMKELEHHLAIPEPHTIRIGDFLIKDEKSPVVTGFEEFHWNKNGTVWICKETGEVRTDADMDRLSRGSKLVRIPIPKPLNNINFQSEH
jgi:hypothetical protein